MWIANSHTGFPGIPSSGIQKWKCAFLMLFFIMIAVEIFYWVHHWFKRRKKWQTNKFVILHLIQINFGIIFEHDRTENVGGHTQLKLCQQSVYWCSNKNRKWTTFVKLENRIDIGYLILCRTPCTVHFTCVVCASRQFSKW